MKMKPLSYNEKTLQEKVAKRFFRNKIFFVLISLILLLTTFSFSQRDLNSELIGAAATGDMNNVRNLLASGADVNANNDKGETALTNSIYKDHTEIAKMLITKGADVNKKGYKGWTALMIAAGKGNNLIVKLLVNSGADVNAKNDAGDTAFSWAVNKGYTEIVKFLLDKGVDVNERDNALNITALIVASQKGHTEIVKILLAKGADTSVKDSTFGLTALNQATNKGHMEIVKILEEWEKINNKTMTTGNMSQTEKSPSESLKKAYLSTMGGIRTIGSALESYQIDHDNKPPEAASTKSLIKLLKEQQYLFDMNIDNFIDIDSIKNSDKFKKLSEEKKKQTLEKLTKLKKEKTELGKDDWGSDLFYKYNKDSYWLASAGSDKIFKGFGQNGNPNFVNGIDVIYSNGEFVFISNQMLQWIYEDRIQ